MTVQNKEPGSVEMEETMDELLEIAEARGHAKETLKDEWFGRLAAEVRRLSAELTLAQEFKQAHLKEFARLKDYEAAPTTEELEEAMQTIDGHETGMSITFAAQRLVRYFRAAHQAPRKKLLPESAEPPTHPSGRGILNGIRDHAAVGAQAAEQGEPCGLYRWQDCALDRCKRDGRCCAPHPASPPQAEEE